MGRKPAADSFTASGVRLGRKPTLTHHPQQEAIKRLNAGKETLAKLRAAIMSAVERFRGFPDGAVIGIASGWWSVSGLIADFVGVSLLGFDLIRVQRMLRANAAGELSRFNAMPKITEA